MQDLTDIGDLAVLYRDEIPQADDFGGIKPPYWNYTTYKLGTNGFIFGPQGGLRIDARELGHILSLVQNYGQWSGLRLFKNTTIKGMISQAWLYNGTNGDTDRSLF